MLDDPAKFLRGAGQEAGHIDKGEDRDFEGVAKTHEARGLLAGVDIEATGQHQRLIGDHAHGAPLHSAEAADDIARVGRLNFKEFALRSEEHTSELQSLMRISYAVFCLKKKKRKHEIII